MNEVPMVSIIGPCRNEDNFIREFLDSILANDYPKNRLEILVVDGMNQDGTCNILADNAKKYGFIGFVDNPGRIAPAAVNRRIITAKSEEIDWMSAVNRHEKKHLSHSVGSLTKYGADNVGESCHLTVRRDCGRQAMERTYKWDTEAVKIIALHNKLLAT